MKKEFYRLINQTILDEYLVQIASDSKFVSKFLVDLERERYLTKEDIQEAKDKIDNIIYVAETLKENDKSSIVSSSKK